MRGGMIDMRMDPTIKAKKTIKVPMNRTVLNTLGGILIGLAVLVLLLCLWEGFLKNARVQMVEVPGFHELQLDSPGLYAGLYQHRGSGVLPAEALSHLDVRILTKGSYEEIPVLLNNTGQSFERFGVRAIPVFNFSIEEPGSYTMSAVYNDNRTGPTVPIFIIPQAAQNIKQTLFVGIVFFALLLFSGIFVLIKRNHWAPKTPLGK